MTDFKYINTSELNPYTTKTFMEESLSVTEYNRWLYVEGTGIIDQLFIDSDQNDYTIKILLDDRILWNTEKPHTWFAARDDWILNVSAYTSGVKYILSLRDLYFKDSFHIEFKPITDATFTTILCRYTVRDAVIKK